MSGPIDDPVTDASRLDACALSLRPTATGPRGSDRPHFGLGSFWHSRMEYQCSRPSLPTHIKHSKYTEIVQK